MSSLAVHVIVVLRAYAAHLHGEYDSAASCRRMQMRLKVFVHKKLREEWHTKDCATAAENTGLGRVSIVHKLLD
jgi:hypothetical protein